MISLFARDWRAYFAQFDLSFLVVLAVSGGVVLLALTLKLLTPRKPGVKATKPAASPVTIAVVLRAGAARFPDKAAVIVGSRSLTYAELENRSRALAGGLLAGGIKPGDRIGVHWSNSVECVLLLFACFEAGIVALPINIRLKAPEIAYIMEHSGAVAWFSQPELAEISRAAAAETPAPLPVRATLPEPLADGVLPVPAPDDLAAILYTSGTTARPKGVMHTQRSMAAAGRLMQAENIDSSQVLLGMTSIMHASCLNMFVMGAFYAGATMILIPVFDAAAVLDLIEKHRCTWIGGLPSMLQFVTEEQERRPRNVASVRTAICGGDTVSEMLRERFRHLFGGTPLREVYALTESPPALSNLPSSSRAGSIGRPLPGIRMRVQDDSGRELAAGQTGELALSSPASFAGYWNDPANTAAVLIDGWVRTGDLGHRDADGFFWFDGRKKEIIIRGGSNISPQEVEEALYQHPAVLEAGVIGERHEIYGEQVVACIALRPGHSATEDELRAFASARIADYKVPERIVFLDLLPKGITGKIQRRALKDILAGAVPTPAG